MFLRSVLCTGLAIGSIESFASAQSPLAGGCGHVSVLVDSAVHGIDISAELLKWRSKR